MEPAWRRFASGKTEGEVSTAERHHRPTLLVIVRAAVEVVVRPVSAPVFACITLLRDGATFAEATRELDEARHLTELQASIATGLFTAIDLQT